MNKWIVLITAVVLMSGCADKTYDAKGAEGLVFSEHQSYRFSLKQSIEPVAAEIDQIVRQARDADHQFQVVYRYATQRGKALATQQMAKHRRSHLAPAQYTMRHTAGIDADLAVEVYLTRLVTEICQPDQLAQPIFRRDCFVETMRMKHVANPKQLLGE